MAFVPSQLNYISPPIFPFGVIIQRTMDYTIISFDI